MIPWQMKFYGIRDYEPTVMDLSGQGDHVLIAGPNGSGKSTITFCMGAVLRSAKVDIDGLKSKNIQHGETWLASIELLFKNEGPSRIDGPLYVAFSLHIEQEPNGLLKCVYKITSGDDKDDLENETVYRSGGQQNFGDYRTALVDKYKIYPDDYYLIWYQQEVNQFSTMSPEERFRVFSEMHGIANIQHAWETSIQQVKEAEEAVFEAESSVSNDKMNLADAKRRYDRLLSHEKSIRDNGRHLIQSLTALHTLYEKDLKNVEENQQQLRIEDDDIKQSLAQLDGKVVVGEEALKEIVKEKELAEQRYEEKQINIQEQNKNVKALKEEIEVLDEALKDLAEKSKRLQLTEAETQALAAEKEDHLSALNVEQQQVKSRQDVLWEENEAALTERAQLKNTIQLFENEQQQNAVLLQQYGSHHAVQSHIDDLSETIAATDKAITAVKVEIEDATRELHGLTNNHVVSKRQQFVLDEMKKAGITAYPLRNLVELQEGVPLKVEQQLDAIKYTIFYDAKEFPPVNDLYHVSLRSIVPEYFMDTCPQFHLQVKKGLRTDEESFAAKVIWWVNQFLTEQPTIEGNRLIDIRGERGGQEAETFILSESALKMRMAELKKRLTTNEQQLENLTAQQDAFIKERGNLYKVTDKVAEAEAFKLKKPQYDYDVKQHAACENRLIAIKNEQNELQEKEGTIREKTSRLTIELEYLKIDLDIYRQLGEQKQQFEKQQETKKRHKVLVANVRALQNELDELDTRLTQIDHKEAAQNRSLNEYAYEKEDFSNKQKSIVRMKNETREEQEIIEEKLVNRRRELDRLNEEIPALFKEVTNEPPLQGLSETKLNEIYFQSNGAYQLERQQTDVNLEAGNIYEKAKENYERNSTELDRSKVLLEENKIRAEENEQWLITSIQMKIMRIQQLFQNYMSHFQFESEVSVDQYENKSGRILFRLFIKVRKQGHRGKMEDVSVKARAGKVGKGVSGGEESLSSLLFALSLLQELDIRPSFIVLDEFDSALDDGRKAKVFELYAEQLERKLIIVSPKGHENDYLNHFQKAYIARHDPNQLRTILAGVRRK